MGFANVKAWADAATDNGQNWISSFRKSPASVTLSGHWYDYSVAGGNPVANYYASTPLVSATLDGNKGIYAGPDVSPMRKYVHRMTMMSASATSTTSSNQNQSMYLLDYVMYYPFIDMDTVGEDQALENTITLPRWTDGRGLRIMLVSQSPTIGGGQFTINYTNQDGVSGRVTPNHFCAPAQPIGAIISSIASTAGFTPFVALQSGDIGVRSVESINFSVANGGLVAVVLVKSYHMQYVAEECRRTTTGNLESYGSASEKEFIRDQSVGSYIEDGAFLGLISQTAGGSINTAVLSGCIEFVWS